MKQKIMPPLLCRWWKVLSKEEKTEGAYKKIQNYVNEYLNYEIVFLLFLQLVPAVGLN